MGWQNESTSFSHFERHIYDRDRKMSNRKKISHSLLKKQMINAGVFPSVIESQEGIGISLISEIKHFTGQKSKLYSNNILVWILEDR